MTHKSPEQFKRLFKAIYETENFYLVHVDKKAADQIYCEIQSFLKDYSNAFLMRRQNCLWGGYSMVDIELKAIEKAVSMFAGWEFFINLSGQCFPLKPQQQIKQFLAENREANFIDVFDPLDNGRWSNPECRVKQIYFEFRGRVMQIPVNRKMPNDFKWYAGSQWFMINKQFCEYVNSYRAKKFVRFFKYTHIPDESFFQTVIMNSEFKQTVINDNKRSIEWGDKCVKILTSDDCEQLISGNAFFARKFDITKDSLIIDKLENYLSSPSHL
jgi:hypothetical protein